MKTSLLLGLLALSAQEPESVLPGGQDDVVDEVTVYADDSLPNLRARLRSVDEAFFKRYNELNSNDDYDMICKLETRIGSQIPRRVCMSRLHRRMVSESASDLAGDLADNTAESIPQESPSWNRRHYRKVREDIADVLQKDEQLRGIVQDRKKILEEIERKKNPSED